MSVGQPKFTRDNITSSSHYIHSVSKPDSAFGVNVAKFVEATPRERGALSGVAGNVLDRLQTLDLFAPESTHSSTSVSEPHPFQRQLGSPDKFTSIPARLAVDLNTETMTVDGALRALVSSGNFDVDTARPLANRVLGLLRVAQQMQVSGEGLNQFEKLVGDKTKVSIHEAIDSGFTQTEEGKTVNDRFARDSAYAIYALPDTHHTLYFKAVLGYLADKGVVPTEEIVPSGVPIPPAAISSSQRVEVIPGAPQIFAPCSGGLGGVDERKNIGRDRLLSLDSSVRPQSAPQQRRSSFSGSVTRTSIPSPPQFLESKDDIGLGLRSVQSLYGSLRPGVPLTSEFSGHEFLGGGDPQRLADQFATASTAESCAEIISRLLRDGSQEDAIKTFADVFSRLTTDGPRANFVAAVGDHGGPGLLAAVFRQLPADGASRTNFVAAALDDSGSTLLAAVFSKLPDGASRNNFVAAVRDHGANLRGDEGGDGGAPLLAAVFSQLPDPESAKLFVAAVREHGARLDGGGDKLLAAVFSQLPDPESAKLFVAAVHDHGANLDQSDQDTGYKLLAAVFSCLTTDDSRTNFIAAVRVHGASLDSDEVRDGGPTLLAAVFSQLPEGDNSRANFVAAVHANGEALLDVDDGGPTLLAAVFRQLPADGASHTNFVAAVRKLGLDEDDGDELLAAVFRQLPADGASRANFVAAALDRGGLTLLAAVFRQLPADGASHTNLVAAVHANGEALVNVDDGGTTLLADVFSQLPEGGNSRANFVAAVREYGATLGHEGGGDGGDGGPTLLADVFSQLPEGGNSRANFVAAVVAHGGGDTTLLSQVAEKLHGDVRDAFNGLAHPED